MNCMKCGGQSGHNVRTCKGRFEVTTRRKKTTHKSQRKKVLGSQAAGATPQSATLTPPTDTLKPTTQGPETARNTTRFKEKLLVSI